MSETRALVVAVDLDLPKRPLQPELEEFLALIEAAGAEVASVSVQHRAAIDPATLVGAGKARELAEIAERDGATALFVLNDIRPRQRANLEKVVPLPIIDRTMLILDIFAQRARSREGKLQVELAQLRHRAANLAGLGTVLSRLGGGVGTRGPGETKLEVDRRRIRTRIAALERDLEQVRRHRRTQRAGRGGEPLAALVGYTNVGKSSLLNRLARAESFVADQPFATLDTTLRKAYLAPGKTALVADTVGFITDLPKELVAAFRATLEELNEADVLLEVFDASNPDWPRQEASVREILGDLGLAGAPAIRVANKVDRLELAARASLPADAVAVSAVSGEGIEALRARMAERLGRG
ncbi:GTPase HflX [bacterium]|nr:MAG: GTPase HflX [bacterium]